MTDEIKKIVSGCFFQLVTPETALAVIEAQATAWRRRYGRPARLMVPFIYWDIAGLPLDMPVRVMVDGEPVYCLRDADSLRFGGCAAP